MTKLPTVLLVEDSPSLAEVYKQYLKKEKISLVYASNGKDAIKQADHYRPELVLLDLKLPDIPGEEVLAHLNKTQVECCVIVITAHGSVDLAVELMRLGAHDFLQKPIDAARLLTTVRNNIEHINLKALVSNLSDSFDRKQYHGFIGGCAAMQAVYQIIESAAASKATIFITGESGTGKEVCAEAIHQQSPRSNAAFIALNCGAIPKDLMESEIFGHVKGAFTGAATERKGAATLADGGTLFLDEIGEMDLELQTKLLRFIQSGYIKKVGGSKEERVDVRFVCATNKDPLAQIADGQFREDLYYRLNVVPIHLPALRERGNDIRLLSNHFLKIYADEDGKKFTRFSDDVAKIFSHYEWPGNVRQLQNIVRNIVVLNDANTVEVKHLPLPFNRNGTPAINPTTTPAKAHQAATQLHECSTQQAPPASTEHITPDNILSQENNTEKTNSHNIGSTNKQEIRPLAIVEREIIESAIEQCGGNISIAAAHLKVSPSTIYRKKQHWGEQTEL